VSSHGEGQGGGSPSIVRPRGAQRQCDHVWSVWSNVEVKIAENVNTYVITRACFVCGRREEYGEN